MTPGTGGAGDPAATTIVPRWEWRTFGNELGAAEARLGELPAERVQESDEVYLVSLDSDASVKVRGGLMDVKQLQRVDDEGLEQWLPVMKASFPLAAAQVRAVLSALHADAPLDRRAYTLDQLIDEIVAPHDRLDAVDVHKDRRHAVLGGCMAELTALEAGSRSTRTIALESEEPALVTAARRTLGLDALPNVCLARGLKALVGFGARRFAVVDVGTNSVKFHVGERDADGAWRTVVDRAEVTRLGQGLGRTGRLGGEPIARTVAAIAAMAAEARADGAEEVAAVGTAGLRIAANAATFVDAVEAACGVHVEVISGEEEARLAYLAARSALAVDDCSLAVFDSGGGSSQFTFGHGDEVDERFSLDVGAVRFTEDFGLADVVSPESLAAALDAIAADLTALEGRPVPDALVGMGGTVTNLAAVKHALAAYDPDVVHGTVLDATEIDRQIELYGSRTADERRRIVGLQPGRAGVILAGACVVRTVLADLGRDSLVVCDRGLRHGLLAERFGREPQHAGFTPAA